MTRRKDQQNARPDSTTEQTNGHEAGHNLTVAELERRTGGLSRPSKMPGFGYSLPASACRRGSKLRDVPGSTCSCCYARKGRFVFPAVQAAMRRRLEAVCASPTWVADMVALLSHRYQGRPSAERFFRWHDSGDLQSAQHLRKIVDVAAATLGIQHWLPTREVAMVKTVIASEIGVPESLTIRISATLVDGPAPEIGLPTAVVLSRPQRVTMLCPAPQQGNSCSSCRACWDRGVSQVAYLEH